MKKVIILLLSFFIINISCLANDSKIRNNLKYKKEIENKVKKEFPKIQKQINKDFISAEKTYKKCLKDKNKKENIYEYIFIIQDYQRGIESYEVILLSDLINITGKYYDIKNKVPATDFAGTLFDFLYPYFETNNINYSKLQKIKLYQNYKLNKLDIYLSNVK